MANLKDKIKGKLMRGEGKLTGDKLREAQGYVTEKKADVENKVSRGVSKMKRKARAAKNTP